MSLRYAFPLLWILICAVDPNVSCGCTWFALCTMLLLGALAWSRSRSAAKPVHKEELQLYAELDATLSGGHLEYSPTCVTGASKLNSLNRNIQLVIDALPTAMPVRLVVVVDYSLFQKTSS